MKKYHEIIVPDILGDSLEEILCLATLTTKGEISLFTTPNKYDTQEYFKSIKECCDNCEYKRECLACKINE